MREFQRYSIYLGTTRPAIINEIGILQNWELYRICDYLKKKSFVAVLCGQSLSGVQLITIPWAAACQAPLSMRFPRQEYWSGLSFPPPGDLPDPGIGPTSPALAGGFFTTAPPGKPPFCGCAMLCLVALLCPPLCDPMACSPPGSSDNGDSPSKNTTVGCHAPPPGYLSNPGIKPRSYTL